MLISFLLSASVVLSPILPVVFAEHVNSSQSTQQEKETIRVHSNLIPVAASVVDAQGGALADLKLEDFELRIDGEKKNISSMTRSETPVKLAVLFDNSGSLNANRHFERDAAARFFRSVLRPKDAAALYVCEPFSQRTARYMPCEPVIVITPTAAI